MTPTPTSEPRIEPGDDVSHRRFVSIRYFTEEMCGMSREWFYKHIQDPMFPRRVWFGTKPMLDFAECQAYIQSLLPKDEPKKEAAPVKRRPGRPVKNPKA